MLDLTHRPTHVNSSVCLFENTYEWFYLAILSSFSLECLFIPSYSVRGHHLHYDTWLYLILESCLNKYCGSKTMKSWTFLLLCAKGVQKGYSFYGLSWNTDSKSDCDESEYVCIYNISLLHHLCSPLLPTWAKWVTYSPLILPQFKYIRPHLYCKLGKCAQTPETQMSNNIHGLSIHFPNHLSYRVIRLLEPIPASLDVDRKTHWMYGQFITCTFLKMYLIQFIYFFIIGLGSWQINNMDMNFRCGKTCVNCLIRIVLTKMTEMKTSKETLM